MDDEVKCAGCGDTFLFTERDKEFYAEREWTPPKRCRTCRAKKKEERKAAGLDD
jgi:hypothetical protein